MAISDEALIAVVCIVSVFYIIIIGISIFSMRIVNHAEVMIVERFGKYRRTLMPGLHFIVPVVDQVRSVHWRYVRATLGGLDTEVISINTPRIDLREHVIDFGRQHVITKDTVQIDIDALIYFRITDPRLAVFMIQNVPDAIEFVTQATLRNIIANMTLDDTFSSREDINSELLNRVQPDVERWGVSITRVEIFNIIPPNDIKAAMEQQIKAERDRRSEVLRADGERESKIINSRGNAARVVLEAEGKRASDVLLAVGEAEARMLASRAEAQSMQVVRAALDDSSVRAVDYITAIQYLTILRDICRNSQSSTITLLPVEVVDSIKHIMKLNSV